MPAARSILPLSAATLLAACAATGDSAPPFCPRVAFLYGLHAVDELDVDGRPLPVRAELSAIRGSCTYGGDVIELDYRFDILVEPTAEVAGGRVRVPWLLVVLDERGAVVARERFSTELEVGRPGERSGASEHLRQTLPTDRARGPAWRVLIALDLPEDEALANWEASRF